MNENIELLEYIYKSSQTGESSLNDLLKDMNEKDNKIKKAINDELGEYKKFSSESKKRLEKYKKDTLTTGLASKLMMKMGIKKEVMMDNSDSAIAKMLIQGLTMGVLEITEKLNNYKDVADKQHLTLAKDFLKFQENSIDDLKNFL